jgi:hypothetical protein
LRLELGVELGAVLLISGEIVFGQNDGLTGEAVTESVERASAFAFGRDRAGGAAFLRLTSALVFSKDEESGVSSD